MRSYYSIITFWLLIAWPCFGLETPCDVTPKNQKDLGLDFSITVTKHERTFIVDFVVPSSSALTNLARVGVFSRQKSFSDPVGLSVPLMGLTRFPRDNPSNPKDVEWVQGFRLWIGENSLANTMISFDHQSKSYAIQLSNYAQQ